MPLTPVEAKGLNHSKQPEYLARKSLVLQRSSALLFLGKAPLSYHTSTNLTRLLRAHQIQSRDHDLQKPSNFIPTSNFIHIVTSDRQILEIITPGYPIQFHSLLLSHPSLGTLVTSGSGFVTSSRSRRGGAHQFSGEKASFSGIFLSWRRKEAGSILDLEDSDTYAISGSGW